MKTAVEYNRLNLSRKLALHSWLTTHERERMSTSMDKLAPMASADLGFSLTACNIGYVYESTGMPHFAQQKVKRSPRGSKAGPATSEAEVERDYLLEAAVRAFIFFRGVVGEFPKDEVARIEDKWAEKGKP